MICNGSEKLVWATFGRPLFVIDRSAKIFTHSQRTDKTVRFFCFCTSLLDEMKKKLYNID